MKKITVLLVLLSCFTIPTNAQFIKKLGKKAKKAAEKAVERRVEKKATEKTEKVLDSTIDRKRNPKKKGAIPTISSAIPAKNYTFNYSSEMQIISGKDKMNILYFLP